MGGTSAGSVSGGETSAGSSGANGSSSGTSGACGANSCSYDNDCGGSRSCYNGCCVDTAETCLHGAAAFGPCAPGWEPDEGGHCCELADGGTGGTSAGSGSTGGTGGTTGGFVCQFDGGVSGGICNPDCPSGFHCSAGACVLNGGNGPIQVTLRFDTHTDLDLHVVEPSGCEVYYGNPTGCAGSLDLDANAGCSTSSVDAENVIYPPLDGGFTPPSGTYTVRVDDWENCSSLATIPFEVIVRHNGQTDTYCEGFGDPAGSGTAPDDHGGAGDGRTIATFTYP